MTITFVGHGYVGLVTAAVFADFGNTVWVIGHTPKKIENLKKGILSIYEPGLEELVKHNIKAKRLLFTLDYKIAIPASSIVFIAVGTPPKPSGEADLSVVFKVAKKIAENLDNYTVVATKSTVPVGVNREIKKIIEQVKPERAAFDVASVPEFLREGQAISDTKNPDRVIIGSDSSAAKDLLVELHKPIGGKNILVGIETAEMIKYAANAFLATKISFANAIARLSEIVHADGLSVLEGIGLDRRIGPSFLSPGAGYGGSCFPKDVRALIAISKQHGYDFDLLKEVENINKEAVRQIIEKSKKMLGGDVKGRTIGILGLAFKPDTDDMRDAPSITIINALQKMGASIKAYDPIATENAKAILNKVNFCNDPYEVADGSDMIVVVTEWSEFRQLNLNRVKKLLKQAIILDGRNIYDSHVMQGLGFTYQGVGR